MKTTGYASNIRDRIHEVLVDLVNGMGSKPSSIETREKLLSSTADRLSIIISDSLVTKDYVEARVIKETDGLATNQNLAKLEDKINQTNKSIYDLELKMVKAMSSLDSKMTRWFINTTVAILAVLVPLILTLK